MSADREAYRQEMSSAEPTAAGGGASRCSRPYLSVHFACCGVYLRIYRAADGKAYRGRCPKCGRPVSFQVGAGGTDCRFFVVR